MVKIQTDFRVLMGHAAEVGKAKKAKDSVRLEAAEKQLEAYRQLCLGADSMGLGRTYGELDSGPPERAKAPRP